MLRLGADENFNGRILRALVRRVDTLDVVRVQDTPLSGADDPTVLRWAAEEGRVLLTHDVSTLIGYAYERVEAGQSMPGVIAVRWSCPIGPAVEELELLSLAISSEEIENQIIYIPL